MPTGTSRWVNAAQLQGTELRASMQSLRVHSREVPAHGFDRNHEPGSCVAEIVSVGMRRLLSEAWRGNPRCYF